MNRSGDLVAFLAVARERSFTRAAAQLGVSASALSHTIRKLEERVGVRLLTRTTRSVSPTEAGERLLRTIGPHFDEIHREVEGLSELRDKPAGTIRITSADHPAQTILWPALEKLLPQYPDIHVEISVDDTLRDIAEERFDAGVRLGEQVAKDMIAVPIGPARTNGCRRRTFLLRKTCSPAHAARSCGAPMHQPSPPYPRGLLCLGVRERAVAS